jgi:hypothetical protein
MEFKMIPDIGVILNYNGKIPSLSYLAMRRLCNEQSSTGVMWDILRHEKKRRAVRRDMIIGEQLSKVISRGRSATKWADLWDTRFSNMDETMLTIRTDLIPCIRKTSAEFWIEVHVPCHILEEMECPGEAYPLIGNMTNTTMKGYMVTEKYADENDLMIKIHMDIEICKTFWFECDFRMSALRKWMEFMKWTHPFNEE